MEWQLNVPLYVFPTMQRTAKPVAHTMETGIFTVTVHGPLKRRNNLSSTTVFFPLVVAGSCAQRISWFLNKMYPIKRL